MTSPVATTFTRNPPHDAIKHLLSGKPLWRPDRRRSEAPPPVTINLKFPTDFTLTVNVVGVPPAVLADGFNALEIKMSQLSDKIAEFKTELAAAVDRVAVDVAELKRLAASGAATPADFAALDEGIATLKALDPLPSFPAVPAEPPTGGGTSP